MQNVTAFFAPAPGKHKGGINDKHIQPVVCPAGMRNDRRRHYNMPCPSDDSLEEEFRWREEHIQ